MIRTGWLVGLLLAPTALWAQDFSGDYVLEGRYSTRRATEVHVEIAEDDGDFTITRTGRFTGWRFRDVPAFTWTTSETNLDGRFLTAHYVLDADGESRGFTDVISPDHFDRDRTATATRNDYHFVATYILSPSGDTIREFMVNRTRRGDHDWWFWSHVNGPRNTPSAASADDLAAELERLSDGLWYVSESDAEFTPLIYRGAAGADLDEVKRLYGVEADRPAETESLYDFSHWLVELDPDDDEDRQAEARRYQALFDYVRANLTNVRVYRIGDEYMEPSRWGLLGGIHVLILGEDAHGNLVGLETFSVET